MRTVAEKIMYEIDIEATSHLSKETIQMKI